MSRILVTGALGQIGSELVPALDHTPTDIDEALRVLEAFPERG